MRLFISHSSKDAVLATKLIALLRSSVDLRSSDIRCTSVDGFRFAGGTNTDQQLRAEVINADAFIGIISPASLESVYVMFELGARWGAAKHLLPVMAPGTKASALTGPLSGITARRLDTYGELHHLVQDLAKELNLTAEPPTVYQSEIESILELAKTSGAESHNTEISADDLRRKILLSIAKLNAQNIEATPQRVAEVLSLDPLFVMERMRQHHNEQFVTFINGGQELTLTTAFFFCPKAWGLVTINEA